MTTPAISRDAHAAPIAPTKGHPPALYMLFASEAWERFSYYGMRAILVLYMMNALRFEQSSASLIYGTYTGLVYLTPLLGGLLADRVLGYRRAIILGGFIMAGGEFLLAVPSTPTFFAGLACLIIGNGFFKPNISTIVGTLYEEGDPRRDRGFTIFYMGINLGATLSPWICGKALGENPALGEHSFNYGFAAAGIGMLIGNFTFIFGQRMLGDRGLAPSQKKLAVKAGDADRDGFRAPPKVEETPKDEPLTHIEKQRVLAIFLVGLFVIFFWMAFEQAGNTMTTWADQKTDRLIFGWDPKASAFQSVNAFFVITLAPVMSWVWKVLGEKKIEPSTPAKMVIGLSLLGFGFLPMVAAAVVAGDGGKASWVFLIFAYLLHTIGELCLSPVGLSFVTKLAPKKLAAMLMGVWFTAVFAGNFLAGLLGSLYEKMTPVAFFSIFIVTSLGAAFVMLMLLKPIKRMMGGVH